MIKTTHEYLLVMLLITNAVLSQNNANFKDNIFYSLKEVFKSLLNVYNLKLNNQHLHADTLSLFAFLNLENIKLSYHSLVQWLSEFDRLTKLNVSDVSENNFTLISEQIKPISKPTMQIPFNDFNPDGFGMRLSW